MHSVDYLLKDPKHTKNETWIEFTIRPVNSNVTFKAQNVD